MALFAIFILMQMIFIIIIGQVLKKIMLKRKNTSTQRVYLVNVF